MRIRQQLKHGNLRWVVDYRDGRGKRRQRFFADRSGALGLAATITEGIPTRQQKPTRTVEWLLGAWIMTTSSRRTPASTEQTRWKARGVLAALQTIGVLSLHQVSWQTWEHLVGHFRSKGQSPSTWAGYLQVWRAAVRWGVRQGIIGPTQPGEMRLSRIQRHPRRWLRRPEIEALVQAVAGSTLELPTALGIYQGLRRAEVCQLSPADLDVGANTLTVRASKNRDWRTIQMHDRLLGYLPAELPADGQLCRNARGETWQPGALTRAFRRRLDRLGPEWRGVNFHGLRHTCASHMAASGRFTLYQIARFLGHKTISVTTQYAHLLPDQIKPEW